jgi:hypothetical protein
LVQKREHDGLEARSRADYIDAEGRLHRGSFVSSPDKRFLELTTVVVTTAAVVGALSEGSRHSPSNPRSADTAGGGIPELHEVCNPITSRTWVPKDPYGPGTGGGFTPTSVDENCHWE